MRASPRRPPSTVTTPNDSELHAVVARYASAWTGAPAPARKPLQPPVPRAASAPVTTLVPLRNYLRMRAPPDCPLSPSLDSAAMQRTGLRCDVCAVDATSAEHLATHMKGQKHARRVLLEKTDGAIAANLAEDADVLRKLQFGKWRCNPCASDMCALTVASHLEGARHRNRLGRWITARSSSHTSPRTTPRIVLSAADAHRRIATSPTGASSPPVPSAVGRATIATPQSPKASACKPVQLVSPPHSPTVTSPKSQHTLSKEASPKPLNALAKEFRPLTNTPSATATLSDTESTTKPDAPSLVGGSSSGVQQPKPLSEPELSPLAQPVVVSKTEAAPNVQPISKPSVKERLCSCNLHCTPVKARSSEALSVRALLSVEIVPASDVAAVSELRLRVNPSLSNGSAKAETTDGANETQDSNEVSLKQSAPVPDERESAPEPSTKPDEQKGASSTTTNGLSSSNVTEATEKKGAEMQDENRNMLEESTSTAPEGETAVPPSGGILKSVTPLVKMVLDDVEMLTTEESQPPTISANGPSASKPVTLLPPVQAPSAPSSMSQMSGLRSKRKASPVAKKSKQGTKSVERDLSAFYCAVCKVQCNADPPFQEHMRSVKHERAMAAAASASGAEAIFGSLWTRAISPMSNVRNKGKNSPPRKKSKCAQLGTPVASEFACALCQVVCNGNEPLQEHLRSNKHTRRVNEAACADTTDARMLAPEPPAAPKQPIVCAVCDVPCTSLENYRAHIAGRPHNRRLLSQRGAAQCEQPALVGASSIRGRPARTAVNYNGAHANANASLR